MLADLKAEITVVVDVYREPTVRLCHIAHLGVSTFGFSFRLRGRDVPSAPVRVELAAPDGSLWSWGRQPGEFAVER
ncbi:MAG: hypothetical protein GEV09_25380 [Pseudonocardiaceae bacterium]|nr:hypothetical protein [Pseudonocardiaceae bacterium]